MNLGAAQPGVHISAPPGTGTPPTPPAPTVVVGIVWRPGVPSAGNHVATWVEVEAFLGTLTADQNPTIYVDAGLAEDATIPAAATDLAGRTTLASFTGLPQIITIADGQYISDPCCLQNIILAGTPTTVPFLHLTLPDTLVLLQNSGIELLAGATAPAISASADQTGLLLTTGSFLYNASASGPVAVVNVEVGGFTHTIGVIGAIGQSMFDESTFSSTDASATLNLDYDASVLVTAQPLFLGTFSPRIVDKAASVFYDDTLASPPSGSSRVQGVIDWLKGVVSANTTNIATLIAEVAANTAAITTLTGQVTTLMTQMAAVVAQLANLPASISFGTWVPTYVIGANLTSLVGSTGYYVQIGAGSGSIVICAVQFTATTTAPTSATNATSTIPIAATFASQDQANGGAVSAAVPTAVTNALRIAAVAATSTVRIAWNSITAATTTYAAWFMYRLP